MSKKTLYLVRHAKSSWDDPSLSDFDRVLDSRGLRDAPRMADFVSKKMDEAGGIKPLFISSPAKRAITTAQIFAKAIGIGDEEIILETGIYHAYASDILSIIHGLHTETNTAFIFGHNPTFTEVANIFRKERISEMPTCSIVRIEAKIDRWSDLNEKTVKKTDFWYPKMLP